MSKQSATLTTTHNLHGGMTKPRYLGLVFDRQRRGESLPQALHRARQAKPGYAVAIFA